MRLPEARKKERERERERKEEKKAMQKAAKHLLVSSWEEVERTRADLELYWYAFKFAELPKV